MSLVRMYAAVPKLHLLPNNMQRRRVTDITSATATLGRNQSGSIIRFDRAAGIVITLPTAREGLWYDFLVKTAVTSNTYQVVAAGTTKVSGTLVAPLDDTVSKSFIGDGSSDTKVSMNGTTTGGRLGTYFRAYCNGTTWTINGMNVSSGSVATPFA
jgi:hypothetical protein